MKKVIKKLRIQLDKLQVVCSEREHKINSKSEEWKESLKGSKYIDDTDYLDYRIHDLSDIIDDLENICNH